MASFFWTRGSHLIASHLKVIMLHKRYAARSHLSLSPISPNMSASIRNKLTWLCSVSQPPTLLRVVNGWSCRVSPLRATGRSLQIPVWQRGSSTLSGELLHLQLPESKAWAAATHTRTFNYSRQIMDTGGMLRPLVGEHLTHCCPLIFTSTLLVTPAATPHAHSFTTTLLEIWGYLSTSNYYFFKSWYRFLFIPW